MSVQCSPSTGLDPRKVAERRARLLPSISQWYPFAPHFLGIPVFSKIGFLGLVLPVSPPLLHLVFESRTWDPSELTPAIEKGDWFYCPELDVFVSWLNYETGDCYLLQNITEDQNLRLLN